MRFNLNLLALARKQKMQTKKERAGRTTARQTGGLRYALPQTSSLRQHKFLRS